MKWLCAILLVMVIAGCNQNDSTKAGNEPAMKSDDSANAVQNKTIDHKDTTIIKTADKNDSLLKRADSIREKINSQREKINKKELVALSETILRKLKEKNYAALADYIHPTLGLRFSMYAYVDTASDKRFLPKKLKALLANQKNIDWGNQGDAEERIILPLAKFINKYFYDVDFLNAKEKSVNKILGSGNSLDNLDEAYPACNFTEFYFPGFDPKLEGSDWRTLRLVFKKYKAKVYLVALVHDQWTI